MFFLLSFRPQRFDRLELGCLDGGVAAEEHAQRDAQRERREADHTGG